jgi:hypothetical protein
MIDWVEHKTDIPNLAELLDQHRRHGGVIVEYDRIISAIVYCRRSSVLEWAPDRVARCKAGLKHALWCGLLGWWSWTGLIVTGICIFNNLLGGLDVTRALTAPPPLPATGDPVLRELETVIKRRQYLLLAFLLVLLALIFLLPRL